MGKKISITLSKGSIEKAIADIQKYKQSLIDKNTLFVQRLAEIGIPVIDQRMASAEGDSSPAHNTYIKINTYQSYSQAVLVVQGKDIAFIEFGSGAHYNGSVGTSPHPKGGELGFTIGSYGKGLGANDFWYYEAETGEKVKSFGTKATMPLYNASVEMRQKMREIAREVFKS